ncbi:hypothetical protein EDD85DRAFT_790639 [Armillaria nabsnona]|nr:hypothetical protein EDD85DRAFT_790639 [Armillaria nabsnona]
MIGSVLNLQSVSSTVFRRCNRSGTFGRGPHHVGFSTEPKERSNGFEGIGSQTPTIRLDTVPKYLSQIMSCLIVRWDDLCTLRAHELRNTVSQIARYLPARLYRRSFYRECQMYQLDNEALSFDKRLGDDPGIPTGRCPTTIASSFF